MASCKNSCGYAGSASATPILNNTLIYMSAGHGTRDVTSLVTLPLDWQYMVSHRWSIRIDHLSCTVVEILSRKDIGVTTLIFGSRDIIGHLTTGLAICGLRPLERRQTDRQTN